MENIQTARQIQRLCVFCGSSSGTRPVYAEAAAQLGRDLAKSKISLVFGGGRVGLMGVLADSVLAAGGQAFGVIPRDLLEKEIAHTRLTHLHVVDSMHERKALMARLADAFVLLPGGYGSWEEFWEVITWAQLGIHCKPCGVLNVAGYYDPLLSLTSLAVTEGFIRPAHREMMIVEAAPDALLSRLAAAPHISEVKWTGEKQ